MKGLSAAGLVAVVWLSVWSFAPGAEASSAPVPTGRIAFASDRLATGFGGGQSGPICPTGNCSDIYLIDADGSGLARLTPANLTGFEGCPTWSPDGSRIAFSRTLRGWHGHPSHQIYVMNADGSGIMQLTFGNELSVCPAWSPDGSTIAFVRRPREGPGIPYGHIALMNPDGSGFREITSGTDYDFRPAWSPDGSEIAFERDFACFCRSAIELMNADGSGLRELVDGLDPAWSPDGTRISFWDSSAQALQTYELATGVVTTIASAAQLGGDPSFDRMSSWTADGQWLATGACCDVSDGVGLVLVSADGSTVVPVPNGGSAMAPVWQPSA